MDDTLESSVADSVRCNRMVYTGYHSVQMPMGVSKQTWTWPPKITLISELYFYSQVIANICMVRDINFFTLSCIIF